MIGWPAQILLLGLGWTALLGISPALAWEPVGRTVTIPGESLSLARRLEAADQLALRSQWPEAIQEYQRLLNEASEESDLVPLSPQHSMQLRWCCHLRLARLPADALRLYRSRVNHQAKKWLDEGQATRNVALLRRVVDEAFCSRYGDMALNLLGDLAFERGCFAEAEHWWRLLALPASVAARPHPAGENKGARQPITPRDLVFPDPQIDVARIRAKQILAQWFQGTSGLTEELRAFRQLHDQARGRLAGQQGFYAEILEKLAQHPPPTSLSMRGQDTWTTFAGTDQRQVVLPSDPQDPNRLNGLCQHGAAWRFHLENHSRDHSPLHFPPNPTRLPDRVMTHSAAARRLAFYPAIVGQHALVADAQRVAAYDLTNGGVTVWDLARNGKQAVPRSVRTTLPATADLRYSVTVTGKHIYARLGAQGVDPEKKGSEADSFLVCLELQSNGTLRQRWLLRSQNEDQDSTAIFEGCPIVSGGRVYIAVTHFTAGQASTSIHCYSADSEETPALLWQRKVCAVRTASRGEQAFRHHLLTMAGPFVAYCNHAGAVIAIDAVTGRRAWSVRYSGSGEAKAAGEQSPRDLAPALYADGRLYVAPVDYEHILCFDVVTGRLFWESDRLEVVHLLGVGCGRLIFTTPDGIRALHVAGGRNAWMQPDCGRIPSFGRGFLAGTWIFWPTVCGIQILNQKDGLPDASRLTPGPLHNIRPGNMAFGSGCLAVANAEELALYVSPAMLLAERRAHLNDNSESLPSRFLLAVAEASAGHGEVALQQLTKIEQQAGTSRWQGKRLADLARRQRYETLLQMAERSKQNRHWTEAANWLKQAANPDFSISERLKARARTVDLWVQAGRPARAVDAAQTILNDRILQQGQILDNHGNPQAAALWASDRMAAIIPEAEARAALDRAAEALVVTSQQEPLEQKFEQLAREFPHASATPAALRRLAKMYEQAKRWGAVAHAYRRYLHYPMPVDQRAVALAGLGQAYEQQQCCQAARQTWQALAHLAGKRTVPDLDQERSVQEWVEDRLQKLSAAQAAAPTDPNVLYRRNWEVVLTKGEYLLPLTEDVAVCGRDCFFQQGRNLVCRDVTTSRSRWLAALFFRPTWVQCYADLVLVAGKEGVSALRLADGQLIWSFHAPTIPHPGQQKELGDFHYAVGRLFCMQGKRWLLSLDAETGRVLWNLWDPATLLSLPVQSGPMASHFYVDRSWIVLQTSSGRCKVLDSATGRQLHELGPCLPLWTQPPVPLSNGHVVLCAGGDRLVAFNLVTGRELWNYVLPCPTNLSGAAPWLVGNRTSLLVVIPRNIGTTLQRLDPQTGQTLWPREVILGSERFEPQMITSDDTAVYYSSRHLLTAYSLDSGRRRWEVSLPESSGTWLVRSIRQGLLAFPPAGRTEEVQCSWLFGSIKWTVAYSWERSLGLGFPVLLFDPQAGRLCQRLNFWTPKPWVQMSGEFDRPWRLIPDMQVQRRLPGGAPPVLQISGNRILVSIPGRAWGLEEESNEPRVMNMQKRQTTAFRQK